MVRAVTEIENGALIQNHGGSFGRAQRRQRAVTEVLGGSHGNDWPGNGHILRRDPLRILAQPPEPPPPPCHLANLPNVMPLSADENGAGAGRSPKSPKSHSPAGYKEQAQEEDTKEDAFRRLMIELTDEHKRQVDELTNENFYLKHRLDAVLGTTWSFHKDGMHGSAKEPDFGALKLSMEQAQKHLANDYTVTEDALILQNAALDKPVNFFARFPWYPVDEISENTRTMLKGLSDMRLTLSTTDQLDDDPNASKSAVKKAERSCCGRCIISPSSVKRLRWEIAGMILLFYDLIMIPIGFFEPEENMFLAVMEWTSLIFWTLDMLASCLTGFFDEGIEIMTPYSILKHYARTWLPLDIAVNGPDWVITIVSTINKNESNKSASVTGLLRIFRVLRCVRLLRIAKMKKMIGRVKDNIRSEVFFIVVNAFQVIMIMLFANHFLGSLYYMVGDMSTDTSDDNWIDAHKIRDKSLLFRYGYSVHWSLSNFALGWSGVKVYNVAETWFCVFVMLGGMVTFSIFVAALTNWMQQIHHASGEISKQTWLLRRYFRQNAVDTNLSFRVLRYVEYKSNIERNTVSTERIPILSKLSENLYHELMFTVTYVDLLSHPLFAFFAGLTRKILYSLVGTTLSTYSAAAKDTIFQRATLATHMYFLGSGDLRYAKAGWTKHLELAPKDWITEMCLWVTWPCRGDLQAVSDCQLIMIESKAFGAAVKEDQAIWAFMSCYVEIFVDWLNDLDFQELTDVCLGHQRIGQGEAARLRIRKFIHDAKIKAENPTGTELE